MEETQKELTPTDYQMYRAEGPKMGGRQRVLEIERAPEQEKQYAVTCSKCEKESRKEPMLSSLKEREREIVLLENRLSVLNIYLQKRGKKNHSHKSRLY